MHGSGERAVAWRQGQLIALADLNIESAAFTHGIMLSQNCDILAARRTEPDVEFILGRFVEIHNPSLLHARHPRTLHLPTSDGRHIHCDIRRRDRLAKDKLPPLPRDVPTLDHRAIATLARWAGRRYYRDALPESFNARLRDRTEELSRISELPGSAYVSAIYVSLSTFDELPTTDKYTVLLCFACRSEHYDQPEHLADAQEFAGKFHACIARCKGLAVDKHCDVRATRDISLEDIESLRRFDYDSRAITGEEVDDVIDV